MISSFFSSIQSPKKLLASKLAESLATYFDVDPSTIETNLVSDAKIVLRKIRLKPQRVGDALLVGQVDEIEFSWTWGGAGDGSTSFVRETILSIRGARFRLIAQAGSSTAPSLSGGATKEEGTGEDPSTSFMDRHVQQILDHLTLNITDVEVIVESIDSSPADTGKKLVLEAKSWQLLSLGRAKSDSGESPSSSSCTTESAPPLSQRLSLGSLRAFILDGNDQKLPLLDSFAYATSVRRVAGRRFLNFEHGLEVVGDIGDYKEDDNLLVIHAGDTQVEILSKIVGELLPNKEEHPSSESPVQQAHSPESSEDSDTVSTVIRLPLPAVVCKLPNGSQIRMAHCTFHHVLDGSKSRLVGFEGIQINECKTPLLKLSAGVGWCLDLVSSTFSVGPGTGESETFFDAQNESQATVNSGVARVEWDEDDMKLIMKGVVSVEKKSRCVVERGLEVIANDASVKTSVPWSVAIDGIVAVKANDYGTGEWIEASIDSPTFTLAEDDVIVPLSAFRVEGVKFGPVSFGSASVLIPVCALSLDSGAFSTESPIQANFQSSEVLERIQAFGSRLASFDLPSQNGLACQDDLADCDSFFSKLRVLVPRLEASVSEPNAALVVTDIQLLNASVQCKTLALKGPEGVCTQVSGIEVDLRQPDLVRATLERIETVRIPGSFQLMKPTTDGVVLSFSPIHGISAEIATMSVELSTETVEAQSTDGSATPQLPFPVHCHLTELFVSNEPGSSTVTHFRSLDVNAFPIVVESPGAESSSTEMQVGVTIDSIENEMGGAQKVCVSGMFLPTNTIVGLVAQADDARLSAGFSSINWAQVFKAKQQASTPKTVWNVPLANLAPLLANVAYKGKVVSTETVLRLPEFKGGPDATLDDVVKHYTTAARRQMPSFFSNASVLGESVVDMGARQVGRMALRNSLAGSVTGSVGGLVASDGISGAIASGKKARGASNDEKYHFGDFTRGSLRALTETTKTGGSLRDSGSSDTAYQVGDFSRGASSGMGTYAGENKSRLGAAGGSSVGMAVGVVVLGPIGLIAGSMLGGRAGSQVFKEKTDSARKEETVSPDADLLGLDTSTTRDRVELSQAPPAVQPSISVGPSPVAYPLSNASVERGSIVDPQENRVQLTGPPSGRPSSLVMDPLSNSQATPPTSINPSAQPFNATFRTEREGTRRLPPAQPHRGAVPVARTRAAQGSSGRPVPAASQNSTDQSYHFGDVTRSIVAKGKKQGGRSEQESYKFGDFTRGLFGKKG